LSETVLLTPWKAYHPLEGKETRYFYFYHAAERPFRLSQMLDDCLALVFDSLSCFAGHCIFSILNKQNKSRDLTVNGSSILSATQRTAGQHEQAHSPTQTSNPSQSLHPSSAFLVSKALSTP
jgi:hypothetical protein